MEMLDYFVLFPNVTEAMALEKRLKEKQLKHTIAPTPRELSKCCGISIKYVLEDEAGIKQVVEEHRIKVEGFYSIDKKSRSVSDRT